MVYEIKDLVIKPKSKQAKIWRYLDFPKFVYLLENKTLYFPRGDKLDDPFEGSTTKPNRRDFVEMMSEAIKNKQKATEYAQETGNVMKLLRASIFINSWHISPSESYAMWKIYSKENNSVAIQSTYSQLTNVLPPNVYVTKVSYINYQTEHIPVGNSYYPFFFKRKEFAYEKELRAFITGRMPVKDIDNDSFEFSLDGIEDGKHVSIDLKNLISSIYVSPFSEPWFVELVKAIVLKYRHKFEVKVSMIAKTPIF